MKGRIISEDKKHKQLRPRSAMYGDKNVLQTITTETTTGQEPSCSLRYPLLCVSKNHTSHGLLSNTTGYSQDTNFFSRKKSNYSAWAWRRLYGFTYPIQDASTPPPTSALRSKLVWWSEVSLNHNWHTHCLLYRGHLLTSFCFLNSFYIWLLLEDTDWNTEHWRYVEQMAAFQSEGTNWHFNTEDNYSIQYFAPKQDQVLSS